MAKKKRGAQARKGNPSVVKQNAAEAAAPATKAGQPSSSEAKVSATAGDGSPSSASKKNGAVRKQEKLWQEIEAKRLANRRKQRRKTAIILSLALLVVLAVIGGLWYGSQSGPKSEGRGSGYLTGTSPQQAAEKKSTESAQGIVLGKDGAWSAAKNVPTIEFYYSYGCPGCLALEHQYGAELDKLATTGKINLVYHPTDTHGLAWTYVAGEAAMQVAQEQPDKFAAFHAGLNQKAFEIMFPQGQLSKEQGNDTELAQPEASLRLVKEVAQAAGVKEQLIKQFKIVEPEKSVLHSWANDWVKAATEDLQLGDQGGVGTPMFIKNGKQEIDAGSFTDVATMQKALSK